MAGASILDNELINIPDCYQDDRLGLGLGLGLGWQLGSTLRFSLLKLVISLISDFRVNVRGRASGRVRVQSSLIFKFPSIVKRAH